MEPFNQPLFFNGLILQERCCESNCTWTIVQGRHIPPQMFFVFVPKKKTFKGSPLQSFIRQFFYISILNSSFLQWLLLWVQKWSFKMCTFFVVFKLCLTCKAPFDHFWPCESWQQKNKKDLQASDFLGGFSGTLPKFNKNRLWKVTWTQ